MLVRCLSREAQLQLSLACGEQKGSIVQRRSAFSTALWSDSKIRSSTQQKFQSLVFLGGTIGAAARAQRVPPHRCGGVRGRSAPPRNFGPLDIKNCYFYTWFLHLNSAQ